MSRFEPDGAVDVSFGTGGTAVTPIGSGTAFANAVAMQPDGKIVVAGTTSTSDALALVRYDTDGVLLFGTGGVVVTPIQDEAVANRALRPSNLPMGRLGSCELLATTHETRRSVRGHRQ